MFCKKIFWDSGLHLLMISLLGFGTCFLPLIVPWGSMDNGKITFDSDVLNSINVHDSFKACIVVSVPLTLNYFIDIFLLIFSRKHDTSFLCNLFLRGIPQFSLIAALVVPNICVLYIAIPNDQPQLFMCLFISRFVLFYHGILGQLWISDDRIFQTKFFTAAHLMFVLCIVFFCWNVTNGNRLQNWLGISYIALALIGGCLCSLEFLKFGLKLRRIGFNQLSANQLSCAIYIVLFSIIAPLLLIMSLTFSMHQSNSIILDMYGLSAFTVFLTVLQSRVNVYMFHQKEHSLELKRQFVRFISHEIRIPLNAVSMGLQLLKQELKDSNANEEAKDALVESSAACQLSLNILNELLAYEKLEAGIMTMSLSVVQSWRLLSQVVRPFRLQARHKNVNLVFPVEESAEATLLRRTFLEIDENRLSEVFRNLLSNAVKFTPKGGSVTVSSELISDIPRSSTGRAMEPIPFLRISITDTGPGISKENLPRIFSEVVQIDPGKLQGGGGSGFGLYFSKAIVDLHNGRVSMASEGEGKGCTFTLDIPVTTKTAAAAASEEKDDSDFIAIRLSRRERVSGREPPIDGISRSLSIVRPFNSSRVTADALVAVVDPRGTSTLLQTPSGPQASAARPPRVLVVDDARSNRKLLLKLLRKKYNLSEAEDGQEALNMVVGSLDTADRFDVVLMDNIMPIMTGPTAARAMRAAGFTGLIIGITGNALPEDVRDFLDNGANRVLPKPVDTTVLENAIRELSREGGHRMTQEV